jgi:hypothetical protein
MEYYIYISPLDFVSHDGTKCMLSPSISASSKVMNIVQKVHQRMRADFFFILQVWFVFIPRAERHVSISGALQEAPVACHARWTHVSQDDSFISSVRILFSWHIRLPFWYLLLGKKYTSNNKFGGNNFIKLMCRPKKITPIIIRIRLDEE